MKKTMFTRGILAGALLACGALTACGGGDGTASTSPAPSTSTAPSAPASALPGTVTTAQYAAGSAELAAFNLLNQYRTQCGFSALQENTLLDQASRAHAVYLTTNGVISDTETAGKPGFTGVTYGDRAIAAGFPNGYVGGESAGYYTYATMSDTQYGQQHILDVLSGVYHIAIATLPFNIIGIGVSKVDYNGHPDDRAALAIGPLQAMQGNLPMTFPCQGTTGVAYQSQGEIPAPPNTSGFWGTPVSVVGNPGDNVVLQSGTMTDNAGHTLTLQLLNAANDSNKILQPYQATTYPTSPLQPTTQYSVNLSGTFNGAPFTRSFTFTTGNVSG